MENAIKKAIEGGFNPTFGDEMMYKKYEDVSRILLDPLFWQALGKQQGWNKSFINQYQEIEECEDENDCEETMSGVDISLRLHYWHNLIDHIADGKSIDDFFNQLIK